MFWNWFKKKNKAPAPAFWETYLTGMAQPAFHRKTPIGEVRFVVFDTETTGLEVKKDQILSIGAVSVLGWTIDLQDSFECYVDQIYQPKSETIAVHGILPVSRDESLTEAEAVRKFVAYLGNSVIVGHHVGFDVGMINRALRRLGAGKLRNKTIDTLALAQRLNPPSGVVKAGDWGLDELSRRFDIPIDDRHTAAGDAYITAVLFMKLVRRMEHRGMRTMGDLLR